MGGHAEVAKLLLKHGAEIESREKNMGGTPLYWAAFVGSKTVVTMLIDNGAEINARDNKGFTPLDMAINKHPKVARLLREHGAKERKTHEEEEEEEW